MKNIIFILLLSISIVPKATTAQTQPPNANFEEWMTLTNGAENPIGWGSSNFAVAQGVPQSIFQTSDAAFGEYALKIVTPSVGATIYTVQAELNEQAFDDGGLPYADRPEQMAVWIKGSIFPGDTAFVRAWLTRWDAETNTTEFIGDAFIGLAGIDTIYSLRLDSFNYVSNAQPDTLYLVAGFGDYTLVTLNAGNEFFVDNIVFTGLSTATGQFAELTGSSVFPNPSDGELHIKLDWGKAADLSITIFNNNGQLMEQFVEKQVLNLDKVLDLSSYTNGYYFLKLTANGKSVTERVILVK